MAEEQTAAAEAEQTGIVDEQTAEVVETAPVAEAPTEVPAEAAGSEAEAPTPEHDLTTQEGIASLRQANPAFDAYVKQLADSSFDAGKAKRDKELRLEQGATERSQAYHAWVTDEIAKGTPVEQIQRQTPLYVKANRDAVMVEQAKTFAEVTFEAFGLDEAARVQWREQLDTISEDPERLSAVAQQLQSQAAEHVATQKVGNLTLEEVPKDSRLHASLRAHIESEVAKELEARAAERPAVGNPPRTPSGSGASGNSINELNAMESKERLQVLAGLTEDERAELWAAAAPGRA